MAKEDRPATRAIHPLNRASRDFDSLVTPIYRGSTVLFDSLADVVDRRRNHDHYRYGLAGTPTSRELALRIAEIEGAHRTFLVPSGQAAIGAVYLAICSAGSHVLLPASAYPPNRTLGDDLLARLGIEVEQYDPSIGGGIAALIRDNTALIWCESPGSITMEVQDVPAIAASAKARDVPVAIDNTYGAGVLFDAFAAGADISVQALTKYVAGHSDVLLGSISDERAGHGAADRANGRATRPRGLARRLQPGAARARNLRAPNARVGEGDARGGAVASRAA